MANKELPKKVYDELAVELGNAIIEMSHPKKDSSKKPKTMAEIHRDIIIKSSDTANSIQDSILKNEKSKNRWRRFFLVFFSVLLIVSLFAIYKFIYLSAIGTIYVSDSIIIALLIYVIANIFSILYFMVKYINNSEYLKLFKNVTQKMLEYIIQEKTINNGGQKTNNETDK